MSTHCSSRCNSHHSRHYSTLLQYHYSKHNCSHHSDLCSSHNSSHYSTNCITTGTTGTTSTPTSLASAASTTADTATHNSSTYYSKHHFSNHIDLCSSYKRNHCITNSICHCHSTSHFDITTGATSPLQPQLQNWSRHHNSKLSSHWSNQCSVHLSTNSKYLGCHCRS